MRLLFVLVMAYVVYIFLVYVPFEENIYQSHRFDDGTFALIDEDYIVGHINFAWQKLPSKFDARYKDGLIVFKTNLMGTEKDYLKRYIVTNPCSLKVDWWGYGKVQLNFFGVDSLIPPQIIDYQTDSLQAVHQLEEKALWVWEPNPKGCKAGRLVFK